MKTIFNKRMLTMLLCLAGLGSMVAPKARADEDKDPPTRVARISFADGSVSLQPGGEGDWGNAARNRPMTIGDKIWVDKDSRAELEVGAVTIHLGSMTALSFLNLDAGITQMRLAEGSVNFRVAELREGDTVELDAPNLAFTVKQAGAFRIDVNENGDATRVTVIRGEGEVTAGGQTYPVHAEERGEFTGTDTVQANFERAPGPDGLDNWAQQRDLREDNSVSRKYVPPDMDGYSDLDENGTWSEQPEYGHVWYPNNVDPGWAPYSYGYWNYVGPWGWTWVDYAPWGFAPFHYGRWNYFGGRWGWCPGPVFGAAIYGPAFVGFFGGGFSFGVGWFPLGFGEPFYPWYHCGFGYGRNINIHNTYIRNVNVFNGGAHTFNYRYAHDVHAVTAANRNTFVNGQAVNRGATHITEAGLRGARVGGTPGVQPNTHSSLGSGNRGVNVARPSTAVQNRSVMARTTPASGAASSHVNTFNSAHLTAGRPANARVSNSTSASGSFSRGTGNTAANNRQAQLSQSRPSSSMNNSSRATSNVPSNRTSGNSGRTWEAQGNATDRGRAPAGFGSSNNGPSQTARNAQADRPPWSRGNASSGGSTPNYSQQRSYNPAPSRGYSNSPGPSRSYSPSQAPSRSYSAPRTYSAPQRSYPAPSRSYSAPSAPRSYSAPSHSSGGGGGGSRGGGGGGGSHGGGSHGGGGGGGRHH